MTVMRPRSPAPRSQLFRTWRFLAAIVAIAADSLAAAGA
jgi:hypothetical protein